MVRVIVVYGRKLNCVLIDNIIELDISPIADRPIADWFEPLNDRSGWRGLIEEIHAAIADDAAELNFEFQGPKEYKAMFDDCLRAHGIFSGTDGLDKKEIAEDTFAEAEKLEHRGSYKLALEKYEAAGRMGHPKSQFKAGEY